MMVKWIEERTYMECPNCHDIWHYEENQTERFKFCPNCGNKQVEDKTQSKKPNCQSCNNYKNEFCDVLDMKPCYPKLGCDYFSEREELKKDTIQVLNKIRAKIEKYKATINKAVSEDESKIEGMKEAYADCLNAIDEYKAEIEPQESEDK